MSTSHKAEDSRGAEGGGALLDGPVGIAVAQFSPGEDIRANLNEMRDLASRAADRGAAVVVFPEYSSYFRPTMGPEFASNAQPLDGMFVDALAVMSTELHLHVVAGLVESTGEKDRFSNTVVALSDSGQRVATYRKMHLYDAFGQRESDWVIPGPLDEPEIFDVGRLRFGLQTCYDVRFPEVTRRIVDAGADVVLIPAEWVSGPLKEQHWRTLLTARAIENTIFVAAADHRPPIGVGNSMIVDPMGVELATIGDEKGVAVAFVAGQRISEVRATNPALTLRRFTTAERVLG